MRGSRILVLLLLAVAVLCAVHREARVEGHCVRPSTDLVSGHEIWPSMCPKSHPYGFGGRVAGTGGKCCKTDTITHSMVGGAGDTCAHGNYVACPGRHPCMSYDSSVHCTQDDALVS